MSRRDYDHLGGMLKRNPDFAGMDFIEDSVTPVVVGGLAEWVDPLEGVELRPGLRLEPAPGHTPGCANLRVASGGREAVFCGDVAHHPVQLLTPELQALGDYDPAQACRTRVDLLERCADDGAILLPGHFPDPTAAAIVRAGAHFNFRYL